MSATKAVDCTLKITVESTLKEGEMKIAVIRDGEMLEYPDVGTTVSVEYDVVGEHTYYVKALFEDADMKFSVYRELLK